VTADARRAIERTRALIEMGRAMDAVPVVQRALADDPENALLLCWLGFSLLQADLMRESLAAADRAVAADPEYEWGYRLRAIVLDHLGRHVDAREAARDAMRADPWEPQGAQLFVWYACRSGAIDDAVAVGRRAVEQFPDHAYVWDAHAWAERSAKNWAAAEHAAREALKLAPHDARLHNNLGALLVGQRRFDEATAAFRTTLALDARQTVTHINLAYCLRELGRMDEAHDVEISGAQAELTRAEAALRVSPHSMPALAERGSALRRLGMSEEARRAYELALEHAVSPVEEARALRLLVWSALLRGQIEEALAYAWRVVREHPDDDGAIVTSSLAAWIGDDADLLKATALLMKESDDVSDVSAAEAQLAMVAGDWELAEAKTAEALRLSTAFFHADLEAIHGYCLLMLGDRTAAEELLRKALITAPDSPGAAHLRDALGRL
jgi:tetratricopeptide (TPR) repeat protein